MDWLLTGILCEAWLKKKEYRSALPVEVAFLEGTLSEWTAEQFRSKDLLIFIGSTGIAVRSMPLTCRARRQTRR